MDLKGTHRVEVPRDRVWAALNDPAVLQQCTPGCQRMEPSADGSFDVLLEVGIAPIKGQYSGKIRISDTVPPAQYKLAVSGNGSTGFVHAEGMIWLQPAHRKPFVSGLIRQKSSAIRLQNPKVAT